MSCGKDLTSTGHSEPMVPHPASPPDSSPTEGSPSSFVWRVLRQLGVPSEELELRTREVLSLAYRQHAASELPGSVAPEPARLVELARRVAARHHRAAFRRRRRCEPLALRPDLDERPGDRARLAALARAIKRLELGRRDVFMLAEIEGLSTEEIADALDVGLSRVRSRLESARVALATAMAERSAFCGRAVRKARSLDDQTRRDLDTLRERSAPPAAVAHRIALGVREDLEHADAREPEAKPTVVAQLARAVAATFALTGFAFVVQQVHERAQVPSHTTVAPAQPAEVDAPTRKHLREGAAPNDERAHAREGDATKLVHARATRELPAPIMP